MMGEKEITLGEVSSAAKVWIRTPLLIQTSHTHLFGQTLIAGLLGLIFLFASVREWVKALILALPFVGTLIDIGGMWLTRFVWPGLSVLVIAGGSLFALGYALITVISLWQLWIGTADRLVHKARLSGPVAAGEPAAIVRTLTLSGFNQDVAIERPA